MTHEQEKGTGAMTFIQIEVPLTDGGSVTMTAQPTVCPDLVITPGIDRNGDTPRFTGTLVLRHTHTGARVAASNYVTGLEKLATALAPFDWAFSDLEHFRSDTDRATAVSEVIRTWDIDQGYSGTVSLWGDDEEKKAARTARPADTLLREELDRWSAQSASIRDRNLAAENRAAWYEAISCSGTGFGLIYLLAVLMRVDPAVADIAARRLYLEWDAGDCLGEWVHQWAQELDSGNELTLDGIPHANPLEEFE